MMKLFLKALKCLFIIFICIAAVFAKQYYLKLQNSVEKPSIIDRHMKYGVPVVVSRMNKQDMPLCFKTTALISPDSAVLCYISKKDHKKLSLHQQVDFSLNEVNIKGEVVELAENIDLDSGMYFLKIQLNKTVEKPLSGYQNIKIYYHYLKDVILMKNDSIFIEGGKTFVWVSESGIANKKEVKTGIRNDSRSEIVSGLEIGDIVVMNGGSGLYQGVLLNENLIAEGSK